MSTGNFVYHKTDIHISGTYPLSFVRFYNAADSALTSLGLGWTHNHNISLRDKVKFVEIIFDDGHHEYYEKNTSGGYNPPTGNFNLLEQKENLFVLTTKEKIKYQFSSDGKILSIVDANHNLTQFSYKDGLLSKVANICGALYFEYAENNLLDKVTDHTGRTVSYRYQNACLIYAKQPSGAVYQYKYNKENKIQQITNAAGVVAIVNKY